MNIKEILESKEALASLIGQEMPINTAIKVSKVQKEFNAILEIYDTRRKALFEKYGEKNGEDLKIKEEHTQEFMKEHDVIIFEELEADIESIDIASLGDISIKPVYLTQLSWLIE